MASAAVKVLALRRPGVCGCGAQLDVGTRAGWDRTLRVVVCLECLRDVMAEPQPSPGSFEHPGVTAAGLPVISVLCFVGADLPLFGTPRIDGVPLLGPKETARLVRRATGALDQDALAGLHRHLASAMPPA